MPSNPNRRGRVPRPRIVPSRPEAWARPARLGDIAQARVFDAVLEGEIAESEALAASTEKRWQRRRERGIDDFDRLPESLARMRGRVAEAQQLLEALRDRFPMP